MYQIKLIIRFILIVTSISLTGCIYTPGHLYIPPPPPVMPPPCGGLCSFSYPP